MTKTFAAVCGVSIALFVFASGWPGNALAQAGNAGTRSPPADAGPGKPEKSGSAVAAGASNLDMRLWSFGDCSRNFPHVETREHKECLRVVGSDEAKDARAIYYCNVSHAKDPVEATRCKEAYFANRTEAEQEGFRARQSNPAAVAAAAAPAPKRDKDAEIAALTRALKTLDPEEPAPAPPPEAAAAPAPPPSSGSASNLMLGIGILLLLAGLGVRQLRNATAAPAPQATARKSNRPKNPSGVRFER